MSAPAPPRPVTLLRFVKIPKSLQTVAMDERELVMYNTIFPRLKQFLSSDLLPGETVTLPIPTIYFSSFMGDGVNDCLVIQNLCADRYFQGLSLHRWQAGETKN